jgi:hypothetical protein
LQYLATSREREREKRERERQRERERESEKKNGEEWRGIERRPGISDILGGIKRNHQQRARAQ